MSLHLYLLARRKEDVLQGEEVDGAQEGGRGEGRQGRRGGESQFISSDLGCYGGEHGGNGSGLCPNILEHQAIR